MKNASDIRTTEPTEPPACLATAYATRAARILGERGSEPPVSKAALLRWHSVAGWTMTFVIVIAVIGFGWSLVQWVGSTGLGLGCVASDNDRCEERVDADSTAYGEGMALAAGCIVAAGLGGGLVRRRLRVAAEVVPNELPRGELPVATALRADEDPMKGECL